MQFKNILLLISSALLIFACSSTKAPEAEDTAAASLDLMQKGFLLSLPENEGWSVIKKSDYKVLLSKRTAEGGYTLQTLVVSLPTFEDENQFLDFIKSRMAKSRKKHKVLSHDINLYTGNNELCVQYNSKEKRKTKKVKALTLEIVSFTCRHPDNVNAGVYIALSKSYIPGSSTEDLTAKASELFDRLYFTEL